LIFFINSFVRIFYSKWSLFLILIRTLTLSGLLSFIQISSTFFLFTCVRFNVVQIYIFIKCSLWYFLSCVLSYLSDWSFCLQKTVNVFCLLYFLSCNCIWIIAIKLLNFSSFQFNWGKINIWSSFLLSLILKYLFFLKCDLPSLLKVRCF
jgi:hypothetical protein